MRSSRALALGVTTLVTTFIRPAGAEVLFRGDLETGDLSQWDYLLKEEGLSVVTEPVAQGKYAAKVTITKNELWTNGLNRVEVQHQPDDAYLTEGKEVYYAFSFFLPQTLTGDNHQLLYFETKETYEQVLQLAVEGEHVRFATQKPAWKVHWEADGKVTAGKWHRVAIHVKWAASADAGQVDLWFDGEQVVTAGKAQTFLGKAAFVQHGILRDTIEQVETLYFDDARAGTTLDDVLPGALPSGGSGGGGGASGGVSSSGGAGSPSGGSSTAGSPGAGSGNSAGSNTGGSGTMAGSASGGSASAGTSPGAAGSSVTPPSPRDDSGCAFQSNDRDGAFSLAALAMGSWWLRRRRKQGVAEM